MKISHLWKHFNLIFNLKTQTTVTSYRRFLITTKITTKYGLVAINQNILRTQNSNWYMHNWFIQ